MLTYKAELVGITVKVTEESYTSKASLLDLDPLPVRDPNNGSEKHAFSGKRIKRVGSIAHPMGASSMPILTVLVMSYAK